MSLSTKNERMQEAIEDSKDTSFKIGTVVANIDPFGLGRIQCAVPDLYDPKQGPVPWIGRSSHSPFGQGSNFGVYGSPAIGSQVRIHLQDGDPHYPVVVSDEYTLANANSKFSSPQTWGFKDPSGNELFVNMASGDWQFTSSSGTTMFYNAAGDKTENIVGKLSITVAGNTVINTTGTTMIESAGTVTVKSTGGAVNVQGNPINLN